MSITFMTSSLEECFERLLEGTLYGRVNAGSGLSNEAINAEIEASCPDDPKDIRRHLYWYRFGPDWFRRDEPDDEE